MNEQFTVSIPAGCSKYARAAQNFFGEIAEYIGSDEAGLADFSKKVTEQPLKKDDVEKLANDAGIETVEKDVVLDALQEVDKGKPDSQKINPRTTDKAPGGQELDAEGLWWDAKINVDSRSKLANGCWRLKKTPQGMTKLDWDHFVLKRKQEIKQVMEGFNFDLQTGEKKVEPATESTEAAAPPPGGKTESTEVAAPPPGGKTESTEVAGNETLQFAPLMARIVKAKRNGEIDEEALNSVAESVGLTCVGDLGKRTDLLAEFVEMVSVMYGVKL